jgi:putative transposase
MKTSTIKTNAMPNAPVGKAWDEVSASFDRFCLAAGIETLSAMMEADAEAACGPRHSRSADRSAIAGGARRARSASMPARSQWSDLGS